MMWIIFASYFGASFLLNSPLTMHLFTAPKEIFYELLVLGVIPGTNVQLDFASVIIIFEIFILIMLIPKFVKAINVLKKNHS